MISEENLGEKLPPTKGDRHATLEGVPREPLDCGMGSLDGGVGLQKEALACRASALTAELIARVSDCVADIRVGEDIREYHGDSERLSTSAIKTYLSGGPEAFYARHVAQTDKDTGSAAKDHGNLLHTWFETLDDSLQFAVVPPTSELTAGGGIGQKALKYAAEKAGPDALVVSPAGFAQAQREIAAVRRAAGDLIDEIVGHEVSIRYEINGHPVRCRADAMTATRFLDLKTTREANPRRDFWKSVVDYGYDVQDWVYQRGMEACGMEAAPLIFIVVSTTSAQCVCGTIPQEMTNAAGDRVLAALEDIALRRELDWWMPDDHGDVIEFFVPARLLGRIG